MEEIADAIADSSADLQTWLNRGGRNMVGEWVIAWINETRDEYEADKVAPPRQWMRDDASSLLDWISDENASDSDSLASVPAGMVDDGIEFYGALPNPLVASVRTLNDETDEDAGEKATAVTEMNPSEPDFRCGSGVVEGQSSDDRSIPDSGRSSEELCSVPQVDNDIVDNLPDNYLQLHNNVATKSNTTSNANHHYETETNSLMTSEPNNSQNTAKSNGTIPNGSVVVCQAVPRKLACCRRMTSRLSCPLRITDTIVCAMPLNLETLKHDGPGFMFVMTDTTDDDTSWAIEHRYKIASSRQPNRWLTEFHTRNVAIEIVWRVKVGRHLEAMKEVYKNLTHFHVHANWFQCSLGTLIEELSEVAHKYSS